MIDFTNAIEEFNNYKGSEKKKTLIYNNKKYLVKFPDPVREKNKNISYINNAFSENDYSENGPEARIAQVLQQIHQKKVSVSFDPKYLDKFKK